MLPSIIETEKAAFAKILVINGMKAGVENLLTFGNELLLALGLDVPIKSINYVYWSDEKQR
jgi:hypothetical protein